MTDSARKRIKLVNSQAKLTVIDLWGVYCGSCIDGIPRLEKLQKEFGTQLQVILATKNSQSEVELLKSQNRIVRGTKLPILTGESGLAALFDKVTVPTEIWASQNGKIVYITHDDIATKKNIQDFFEGSRLNMYETKDTIVNNDENHPFASSLQFIHEGDFGISFYLAPHKETKYAYSISAGGFEDTATIKWIKFQKAEFHPLYKCAYGVLYDLSFTNNRFISEFTEPGNQDTMDKGLFDFELISKKKSISSNRFYQLAAQGLDAYFGIHSRMAKRAVPCYVIKRVGNRDRLTPSSSESNLEMDDSLLTATNIPWSDLLATIKNTHWNSEPLLDETGLDPKQKISCQFNIDFDKNLEAINQSLLPYGLAISKEEREMDCIIFEQTL